MLKETCWLILKRSENLDENAKGGDEHKRLQAAFNFNASLATAYYLKEELPLIFEEPNKAAAGRYLDDWAARAHASGIRVLKTFANTLLGYRSGVLAWFDHAISSGPMEGTNNKIKTMKRQAYGYRDLEYFKLRILLLHTTTYKLIG